MSVIPNFCCDKTKNRGAYTRVTVLWPVFWLGRLFSPRVTFLVIPTGSVWRSGYNLSGDMGFLPASLLS